MTPLLRFLDALNHIVRDCSQVKQVLIIGPGFTDPVDALLDMLPGAHLTLIDVNEAVIAELWKRQVKSQRITCICADASTSNVVGSGLYDLLVMRHPDIARFPDQWRGVLGQVAHWLTADGLIIITTYSLDEVQFVKSLLQQLVTLSADAPYTSKPLDLQGNDRYIVAYRRIEQVIALHSGSTRK
jgi:hypothetical protein